MPVPVKVTTAPSKVAGPETNSKVTGKLELAVADNVTEVADKS